MNHILLSVVISVIPIAALSETSNPVIRNIVAEHILPRFEALALSSERLVNAAEADCSPTSETLRAAYGTAFDDWVLASHLRFGPTETEDRAFALAFWPDSRGATPRALNALIADQDPVSASPTDYSQVSIAARGFYALEFLLFDDVLIDAGEPDYHCTLVRTISRDIALTTTAISDDWHADYAATLLTPGPDGLYRSDEEALQEAFKALTTGLQFTSETRLGRPLGRFDQPRPTRSEARRSGRSAHHVKLSLSALRDLAGRLTETDPDLALSLDHKFGRALSQLNDLDDPAFAGVADPQSRLKIEVIQQSVEAIRAEVRDDLGPTLGVAAGFNSLDGD